MILSDHHQFFIFFISCFIFCVNLISAQNYTQFNVGVILDMDSPVGKIGWSCISMGLDDFYAVHTNYSTRLVLHRRNSSGDVVGAAFAALDLLRNAEVRAIIGPQKSTQADFVMNLGDKAHVPIISFSATSPSLSNQTPYFVRTAQDDSAQVKSIVAIIQAFKWREVVLIYEDTQYGHGLVPYLVDALLEIKARVPYRTLISHEATGDQIHEELDKLKNMYNRVFIVHMTQSIGFRFFLKVKEAGMMSNGYAWIVTEGITDLVDFMDSNLTAAMQGVLGVRPYVPKSNALDDRWKKKFRQENPDFDRAELNVFGLWAYDTAWMLAMAVERIGLTTLATTNTSILSFNSTNFGGINTSPIGENLLKQILNTRFKGLGGDFHLINGQLQSSIFQIVNVIGRGERKVGFWSAKHGISQDLDVSNDTMYMTSTTNFRGIIWPGETTIVPKGWVIPTSGKKLKIAVPYTPFTDFVKVDHDTSTNTTIIKGYSIDIFNAVVDTLPYALPYEFVPFEICKGVNNTYDDIIHQVYLKKFDAVVGTTAITANRSLYVDFTLPYTDGGVSMLVPIKFDRQKSAWIFLEPLTEELWLTTLAFFILTGLVVWVLEHRINDAFRGPLSQSLGKVLWFPLSTLVFAHRERVVSNLAQFVVMIWVFVMLIFNSSYTASLSSMLTIEKLQPAVTSIQELIENGDYVGHQQGSFILDMLKGMNFDESKIKPFDSVEEFGKALSKGSQNGGISAFFAATPYMKGFITQYCDKYTIVGPVNMTDGFGFVFPRGSPLVDDVSRAILKITQGHKIVEIDRGYGFQTRSCSQRDNKGMSSRLSLYSFRGLFIITGTVSCFALLVFLAIFVYKHRKVLTSNNSSNTFWVRLQTMFRQFDEKDLSSYRYKRKEVVIFVDRDQSVEIRDIETSPGFSQSSFYISASPSPIPNIISSDHGASNESLAVEEIVEMKLNDPQPYT